MITVLEVMAMPRKARTRAERGINHVMLRGINCQQIFEDEEDNEIKAIRESSKTTEKVGKW